MQVPKIYPDSKVHGAIMGPIWDRQHPGEPHVGHMGTDPNLVIPFPAEGVTPLGARPSAFTMVNINLGITISKPTLLFGHHQPIGDQMTSSNMADEISTNIAAFRV